MRGEGSGSGQRRDDGPGRGGRGLWGLSGLGESDGLDRVEGVEPDGREGLLFIWSSVSSTRSGFPLCRSSSRSSFNARLMVSSMSCAMVCVLSVRVRCSGTLQCSEDGDWRMGGLSLSLSLSLRRDS